MWGQLLLARASVLGFFFCFFFLGGGLEFRLLLTVEGRAVAAFFRLGDFELLFKG